MTALKAAEYATRPAARERDALLDAAGRRVKVKERLDSGLKTRSPKEKRCGKTIEAQRKCKKQLKLKGK
jgi:hypothetical protein